MQNLERTKNNFNTPVKTQTKHLGFFMLCDEQGISSPGTGVFLFLKSRKGINSYNGQARVNKVWGNGSF